jgi:5-(carboxyamino)imidazole ribonucleotide synthase
MQEPILPGRTIGFLGAGQLARMTSHAAQRLGYRTLCWSGGGDATPTRQVAGEVMETPFSCEKSFQRLLTECSVITVETENIPIELLDALTGIDILRPRSQAVRIAGDRRLEREFISSVGLAQTEYRIAQSDAQIAEAFADLGDCIAKTARDGYDGKGQWRIRSEQDIARCLTERKHYELVVEKFIPFEREVSILVARCASGEIKIFDPAENIHRHHVLDMSIVPARLNAPVLSQLQTIAEKVVVALDYIGILAIETFVTKDERVLINELAPRPHNSGHHTMDACVTSQFDIHIRAICNLPLSSVELFSPVVMVNLLSDQWSPEIQGVHHPSYRDFPKAVWHLYEKEWVVGRRKLGHVNFLDGSGEQALSTANQFRELLAKQTALLSSI